MKTQLLSLLIFHFAFLFFHCEAQTNVSGFINANTTWTVSGSPYIVVSNALLSQGYQLTIQPGVVVKFSDSTALQIDGELIAIGTAANRITFTSTQLNPVSGSWAKIHFSSYSTDAVFNASGDYVSGCILKYCDILNGGELGYGVIHIEGASPYISQCNIRNSKASGVYCLGSACLVDSSYIGNNADYGLYFDQMAQHSCGLVVNGDTIRNNQKGGLWMGSGNSACTYEIKYCSFLFNNYYGAIFDGFVLQNVIIRNNNFQNNATATSGIVNFLTTVNMQNFRITDNYFYNNNGHNGIIYLDYAVSGLTISRNYFLNNIAFSGVLNLHASLLYDTIACNYFVGNQLSDACINILTQSGLVNGQVHHNFFDSNVCNAGTKIAVLSLMNPGGGLDFSYNTLKYNNAVNGKIIHIKANVNDTLQRLRIHHNDLYANVANRILSIASNQINDINKDFLYLKYNNFLDAGNEYSLYDSIPYGSPNIYADSNYWGSTSTQYVDSIIYDYFDFANQSVVHYAPILQNAVVIDTTCPLPIISVPELSVNESHFLVYPNPSHGSFTVILNKELGIGNRELHVYDVTGREVYATAIRNRYSVISDQNFSPGIYFVRVIDGKRSASQKLIIQ